MDAEMQEEPTVPSSGAATDEPVIPTNLEHQVKTTEEAVTQETVTDRLGRMEVIAQGPTEPVQVASQPKPALGPAKIPGMMEVELVQMAQATTSLTASSMGNQEPAGDRVSPRGPRGKDMTPQTVTLEMTRAVTMKEVTRRHPQYLLVYQVLQVHGPISPVPLLTTHPLV